MATKAVLLLTLVAAVIAPMDAYSQSWFRVRDLSDTPISTRLKWAAQWLFAPEQLARVRNLYGYELNATCQSLGNAPRAPDTPLNDVDIGIGALVVVSPQSEDAIALKLEEPDVRETVGTVSGLCEIAQNQSTDPSNQSDDLVSQLERCGENGIECYVATGLMVPLDGANPVRQFWTESGIVERYVSQGWVRINENWTRSHLQTGNGELLSSNDVVSPDSSVYVYRNDTTNEVVGVLPPRSRVRVLAQHGSPGAGDWASIIPSQTN